MNEEYVWTARAKGLREFKVIFKHALRNALIPVIIMSGVITGLLMGGAVLTETVFGLPGMGRLLVDSIAVRDFPVALACVLLFAAGYNLINLAADIVCGLVDVRASYD
jgi:glutathione transport system permease protein